MTKARETVLELTCFEAEAQNTNRPRASPGVRLMMYSDNKIR